MFGGGQIAEFDTIFSWFYKGWYPQPTIGPNGSDLPWVWHDMLESHLERSGKPYLLFEFTPTHGGTELVHADIWVFSWFLVDFDRMHGHRRTRSRI